MSDDYYDDGVRAGYEEACDDLAETLKSLRQELKEKDMGLIEMQFKVNCLVKDVKELEIKLAERTGQRNTAIEHNQRLSKNSSDRISLLEEMISSSVKFIQDSDEEIEWKTKYQEELAKIRGYTTPKEGGK